ncbi:hypothetical protein BZA70DRAFT_92973 [Myxozyma melibiosi]|uniref:threonine--tRNA ligase n=1 Tax=Myxozyma melibiosi TaxID=54550 RepID=A0ABR1EYS9_9ASCO
MWGLIPRLSRLSSLAYCSRRAVARQEIARRWCATHSDGDKDQVAAETEATFKDHRRIGLQQELYMINEHTPGSIFLLPHGTRIYNRLLLFIRAQMKQFRFDEVVSPIIYKRALWNTSGHWDKYKEEMFEVKGRSEADSEQYGLKPMNCPGHCLIYRHIDRSYRDLPIRYADFSPLHRNESTTTITGLTRVRRFHQDDGHIFCRVDQISVEIQQALKLIDEVYKVFDVPSYRLLLSTRPEQYIGSLEDWDRAESALREALDFSAHDWKLNEGDGAFYGPKIDILLKDQNGKEHQAATIQLDFQLPQRFDLKYRGEDDSTEHRPVMIHRAVFGSLERFLAILMEQTQGNWPLWISPRQVLVLPITDQHAAYAEKAQSILSGLPLGAPTRLLDSNAETFFVDVDDRSETLGKRMREGIQKGYTYLAVIGDKEVESGTISLKKAKGGKKSKQMTFTLEEARKFLEDEVAQYH